MAAGRNALRLWDTETGKARPWPVGHSGAVEEIGVAADGKTIVTRASDGTLRQWDAATGKELRRLALPSGGDPAGLSRTGRFLAVIPDEKSVVLWDPAAGTEVRKIALPPPAPGGDLTAPGAYQAKVSPDEKVLATVELPRTIRLWDTATGKALGDLAEDPAEEAPSQVIGLEFSPDGKALVTGVVLNATAALGVPPPAAPGGAAEKPPEPKTVLRVWDTATGRTRRRWEVAGSVTAAVFTPDGRSLATATAERISLWEIATGKERLRCEDGAAQLACSPDGRALAAASGTTVLLLDLRTGKVFGRLRGHEASVSPLAFTADGKALVSGSADSTALVWDATRLAPPAPARSDELAAKALDEAWADLASQDAARAYRAVVALSAVPKQAAALLGERVKPATGPDPKELRRRIAELDSDSFEARKKAEEELSKLGEVAAPALRQALADRPSAEMRRRLDDLLARLNPGRSLSADELRQVRAVEVLEGAATPESRAVLRELAKGAPGARLTVEAATALRRLGK
jgi:hypothetical protein